MSNTYLFKYNPKSWTWLDLADLATLVNGGDRVVYTWSTGRSRRPSVGDRAYIIRLGLEPKGIFGSGIIDTDPVGRPHRDPHRAAQGVRDYAVEISLDTLLVPEQDNILSLDELQRDPLSAMFWTTQGTCVEIPPIVAAELEEAWTPYAYGHAVRPPDDLPSHSGSWKAQRRRWWSTPMSGVRRRAGAVSPSTVRDVQSAESTLKTSMETWHVNWSMCTT